MSNKKIIIYLILLVLLLVILLYQLNLITIIDITQFIFVLIATFLGVFVAFKLNEKAENYRRGNKYKILKKALLLEFNNNKRLIDKERISGISFETFKMVISDEVFIEFAINNRNLGKDFVNLLWEIISELREIKENGEIKKYKDGGK